ncbi:sigma-70 family RNA polymerase sigma factor [Crocinitomix catalasitica]|nr:sigma-70 family RNA polymerase sigma factor [Crocinitomix catalasitica]
MNPDLVNIDLGDEHLLVNKCIEDDRKYQEIFYRRYAKTMYRVCKTYTEDRDEAMDFLQEGFVTVFRSLKNYRFEGSLEGWVKKVIVFKTIDELRKRKRYEEVITDYHLESVSDLEGEADSSFLPSAEKIRALVNSLPGKAGLVLKLYVLEGLTHVEIAEHMDITVGTSKSQLNRARQLIKASISTVGE